MNIEFKSASTADLDILISMAWEKYAFAKIELDETCIRSALQELMQHEENGLIWLIQREGVTIGYVIVTFGFILEFHGRHAVLDEIYLMQDFRGQGFGKQTLAFVEKYCRDRGMKALRLEVERANAGAQWVYQNAGFVPHDRVLMTKRLAI